MEKIKIAQIIMDFLLEVSNASKDGKITIDEIVMIVFRLYINYGKEVIK